MEVKDIVKPAVVISVSDTFESALQAMINQKTNTLLVVDDEGGLCGEVTVADLLSAIVPVNLSGDEVIAHFSDDEAITAAIGEARNTPVEDFMSYDFSPLELDDNLLTIISTAMGHQRARIPVVNKENRPIGIISRQGLKSVLAKFL